MDKPRNLLVVIDPTATEHPALERARELALAFRARVELFACYTNGAGELHVDERVLERMANGLRDQGIETSTDEASAASIYSGIVSKVLRSRPCLVIKDTHPHSLLRRTLIPNTDWQLIRLCPAPLLFVRPGDWHFPPRIAAAVDVAPPGEKPTRLDHSLLAMAESFAVATGGRLHAAHAYQPVSLMAASATVRAAPMAALPENAIAEGRAYAQEQFDQLLSTHPVAPERRHLLGGAPGDALVKFVRNAGIDLLVVGAFARGWMYNVFVGSTTERILDLLPCDVLVMKPMRVNR